MKYLSRFLLIISASVAVLSFAGCSNGKNLPEDSSLTHSGMQSNHSAYTQSAAEDTVSTAYEPKNPVESPFIQMQFTSVALLDTSQALVVNGEIKTVKTITGTQELSGLEDALNADKWDRCTVDDWIKTSPELPGQKALVIECSDSKRFALNLFIDNTGTGNWVSLSEIDNGDEYSDTIGYNDDEHFARYIVSPQTCAALLKLFD